MKKTSNKRPAKPFKGAVDGVPFSASNQPSPEAKKKGWQEWRKERHLTQAIIKEMIGEDGQASDSFNGYIKALLANAKLGNAKAIETVNKCLEDDIMKVAQVDSEGKDVVPSITVKVIKPSGE